MENQKKENVKVESKKEEINVEVIPFKSSFELSIEEVNKLPKVLCQIEHRITRTGTNVYSLTMRFDGKDYSYKKSVDFRDFGEAQYNHFIRKRKLDGRKAHFVLELPIRFLKGVNKFAREYKQYQLFLSDKITITGFLKYFDISELEDIGYKIDWVESGIVDIEVEKEF